MKLLVFLCLLAFSWSGVSSQAVYDCDHSVATQFGHSWNCSKFVQCVNGNPVERECEEGFLFSEEHQQCLKSNKVDCPLPCPGLPPTYTELGYYYLTREIGIGSNYVLCLRRHRTVPMQCVEKDSRFNLQCVSDFRMVNSWSMVILENIYYFLFRDISLIALKLTDISNSLDIDLEPGTSVELLFLLRIPRSMYDLCRCGNGCISSEPRLFCQFICRL